MIRWALQNYLGITDRDPEPLPFDESRAREVTGRYENEVMTFTVGIDAAAQRMAQRMALRMEVRIKPEIRSAVDKEPPPDPAPFEVGLLPATSTSSPAASTRASAVSSPATRAARLPASTWPGG